MLLPTVTTKYQTNEKTINLLKTFLVFLSFFFFQTCGAHWTDRFVCTKTDSTAKDFSPPKLLFGRGCVKPSLSQLIGGTNLLLFLCSNWPLETRAQKHESGNRSLHWSDLQEHLPQLWGAQCSHVLTNVTDGVRWDKCSRRCVLHLCVLHNVYQLLLQLRSSSWNNRRRSWHIRTRHPKWKYRLYYKAPRAPKQIFQNECAGYAWTKYFVIWSSFQLNNFNSNTQKTVTPHSNSSFVSRISQ